MNLYIYIYNLFEVKYSFMEIIDFIIFGLGGNNDKKFSISFYYWIKECIDTSTVDYVLNWNAETSNPVLPHAVG